MLFSNKDLKKLIIPLIIEQILVIAVGMADTVMISGVGEAAVSGVSLVDTVNVLIINILSALATGGAVAAGHYLGQKDKENACKSAWQLIFFSVILAVVITVIFIGMHDFILRHVFGSIDAQVMQNAKTYLLITAFSFVPLAVYNAGAALFRAMGNSKVTMWVSTVMNVINITGNAIMIYGLKMGVAGAAIPTTVSRTVAAVIIFAMLFQKKRDIHISGHVTWHLHLRMIKQILYVGVPNGLENSLFQLGKILLLSLISTIGTAAIAANAVANTITMFNILPGIAIGYAQLSTVSICVGAGDAKQARYYTKKLMWITYLGMALMSTAIFFTAHYILKIYGLSAETERLTIEVVRYHAIMVLIAWVPSFSTPNSFRAAGDVILPMVIAIASMWIFRIAAAYILTVQLGMGLMGVWIAMTIDWAFRAICYTIRYRGNSWLKKIQGTEN
ncbi:MAG: MATE family efflux transporter [Lachnospiraceae bacterium]|nr:MATE family efflux transporter [Lachnospiraceae bacterium]